MGDRQLHEYQRSNHDTQAPSGASCQRKAADPRHYRQNRSGKEENECRCIAQKKAHMMKGSHKTKSAAQSAGTL